MRHGIGSALVGGVIMATLLAPVVFAQQATRNSAGPAALQVVDGVQVEGGAPQPAWGTASSMTASYTFVAFHPIDTGVTTGTAVLGNLGSEQICTYRTGGDPWLEAPISLPSGALIQSIQFRLCDSNAGAGLSSFLTINDDTAPVVQLPLVTTTDPEMPGCVNRTWVFGPPVQVDNSTKAYSIEMHMPTTDQTLAVCNARVSYRLQVSPAPAFATFNDVPVSHPFHRFIEALAASGITGGCGGGSYCPDSPVTRGQMAVFLSIALGLHFPG